MTKDMMAKALSEFFVKHKKLLDLAEYKACGNNVPVKDYMARRAFGSWSRVLSSVMKRYPIDFEALNTPVVAPKVEVKVEAPVATPKAAPKAKVEKKDVK